MSIPFRLARRLWPATLLLAGAATAAPLHYTLDPDHTYPSFEADHMGISTWRGKFDHSQGKVELDRAAGTGSLEVGIALDSIDFGQAALNEWARGKDFFDVAHHPRAVYKGRLTGFVDGAPTRVEGSLTLHGVTRPVTLRIERFKCIPHPVLKREYCGADAFGSFDRSAFGLDAGKNYGFDMQVALRIQVEALRDK
jgi:polyisoprenoid-binding protein YceI